MRALMILLLTAVGFAGVTACAAEPQRDRTARIDATDAVVLDVRTSTEFAEGHLRGALNLDVRDDAGFHRGIDELDPEAAYVVYCSTGNRSAAAVEILRERGFTRVVDAGGITEAGEGTGLPVVTR